MIIDDTRADLAVRVREWGVLAGRMWVDMLDGNSSWIDIRSNLADELYRRAGEAAGR
jgi:hypothetical protein